MADGYKKRGPSEVRCAFFFVYNKIERAGEIETRRLFYWQKHECWVWSTFEKVGKYIKRALVLLCAGS